MFEEEVERAHDAACNEPNAPAPDAMHAELVNLLLARTGGKVLRPKAESIVTDMLDKQMRFYSQMATPELAVDSVEQMSVVADMMGLGNAVIRQGAAMVEHMLPAQRDNWQSTVTRYRASLERLGEFFS